MRIRRRVRPCPLRPQGRRQGQAGFTLIEMMVVVAIIGIVMAIAMPAYSSWQERTAVTSAASSLMAHLKQARTLAMAENRSISVTLASNSYTFDADTSGTCGQCKNLTVSLSQFSNNLALSTNLTPVTFSSSGSINSLGATITFAASGYSRDITVNMIGRAYY